MHEQVDPPEGVRARSVGADAAASVGARIVAMVASSVTALLIVAALDKRDYGAYALAAGIAGVLAVALDLGASSSVARFVTAGRASLAVFARVAGARALLLLAAGVALAAVGTAGSERDAVLRLLPAAAALLVVQGLVAYLYGTLPSMGRIRLLVTITVLQPVAELVGVLVARSRSGDAVDMLVASAVAGALASLVGYGAVLLGTRTRATTVDPVGIREVYAYGRNLVAVLVLMMVFGQLDQFVIAAFHGAAAVAPYALVVKLQALIVAPVVAAVGVIAPRIARAGTEAASTYRRWLCLVLVVYSGITAIVGVLAVETFRAINPDYVDDAPLLAAMLPFIFLATASVLPSITLNQVGHAGSRVRLAAVSLAIDAGLDLALVPPFGAFGAAIATTSAFAYYAWGHHRLLDPYLVERSGSAPASSAPVLARGAVLVVLVVLVAAALRWGLDPVMDDGRLGTLLLLAIAGGVPGVLLLLGAARIVRRGMPDAR